MTLKEKLMNIQNELKAPKNMYNGYGKYKYRNAESILEALKPLLLKYKATVILNDDIELIGERYYLQATVTMYDAESDELHIAQALARESLDKKGMDDSQITGTASSYARKYALNGMFLLDDTKDADTDEYHEQNTRKTEAYISKDMLKELQELCKKAGREESYIAKSFKCDSLADLPLDKFAKTKAGLMSIISKNKESKTNE